MTRSELRASLERALAAREAAAESARIEAQAAQQATWAAANARQDADRAAYRAETAAIHARHTPASGEYVSLDYTNQTHEVPANAGDASALLGGTREPAEF